MDDAKVIVTKKGLEDLEAELAELIALRKSIADDIENARKQGDLSENSAYKAALERKEFNENRIQQLQAKLQKVEISVANKEGKVEVGNTVKIFNVKENKEHIFEIVGQDEADPTKGKISISSPIGAALSGKKKGDKVKVQLPAGEITYEVKEVK